MLLVRPVEYRDLPALEELAIKARGLVTTLPSNRDYLAELVANTCHALSADVIVAGGETYHFVLEETVTGQVQGIAGIDSAVGLKSPFYSFQQEDIVHASPEMQMHNRIPALRLCHEYTGSSALCTFFIDPEYDVPASMNLLSRARLLFIAVHRQRFSERIMAEMPGVRDEQGISPFWESLGQHFFSMDFNQAVYLAGIRAKSFIADLLPQHPIYIPMLTSSARKVLGKVHPQRKQVMDRLQEEGFAVHKCVGIFDGGPQLEARTAELLSLRRSECLSFTVGEKKQGEMPFLVSNGSLHNFRCLHTTLEQKQPVLTSAEYDRLQASTYDLWCVPV